MYIVFKRRDAKSTLSIVANENKRIFATGESSAATLLSEFSSVAEATFAESVLAEESVACASDGESVLSLLSATSIFSFTLPRRSRSVSAPSSLFTVSDFLASFSPAGDGENLENLVSSSSGSSTLVIISTIESEEAGIASIIRGMSLASNPNSKAACCIISWKSDFAFSVP